MFYNYKDFASKKSVIYISLVTMFICCIVKLFTGSISLNGEYVFNYMVADYWNFGKELLNEKILYKDLVDHKGLYLYAIYSFMVSISNNHVVIVPIMETILYISTIIVFYKHMLLNNKDTKKNQSLFPTSVFAIIYLLLTYKVTMINTECFEFLAIVYIWDLIKHKRKTDCKTFFQIGIILGILCNFKITTILPFISIFVFAYVLHLKEQRETPMFLKSTIFGIIGFFIANVPYIFYIIKNNCFDELIKINNCVFQKSENLSLTMLIIPTIVSIFSAICLHKNKEKDASFFMNLSMLMIAFQFGDNYNYYIALYIPIAMIEMFQNNKVNLWMILFILLVFGKDVVKNMELSSGISMNNRTLYVSEKYDINNSNILYLEEDNGYGIYSNEMFQEPLQWYPNMMMYSEEFTEYYTNLTIERIKKQKFKYISFLTESQIFITKEQYLWKMLYFFNQKTIVHY